MVLVLAVIGGFPDRTATAGTGEYGDNRPALYAINLLSTRTRMEPASFPTVRVSPPRQLYTTTAYIDGATWYRLRLGFFASEADARLALASLMDEYPGAWVTSVSDYEQDLSAGNIAARDTDQPGSTGPGTTETASDTGSGSILCSEPMFDS